LSLNRTSVGLKLAHGLDLDDGALWPQSNQRGIETRIPRPGEGGELQGLNRTSVGLKLLQPGVRNQTPGQGLNRTSVGLKLAHGLDLDDGALWPQSNQRGIETRILRPGEGGELQGLNRTSVGLKLLQPGVRNQTPGQGLNRTSVGLKPEEHNSSGDVSLWASIEPAWD
jgi:hypothetical protein